MNKAVNIINSSLSALMKVLLYPLEGLPKGLQLVIVSLLAGIGLLLLYGKVSNQKKLRDVKTRIYASFLEAILFRHDGLLTLRAQGRMFRLACVYFALAVPAIMVLAAPCILLLGQLSLYYGYRPLSLNEDVMLQVEYKDVEAVKRAALESSGSIEVVTPPVRVLSKKEATWRVRPIKEGPGFIKIAEHTEEVITVNERKAIVNGRVSNWLLSFLYPGSPILDSQSPIEELWINYPEAYYTILGFQWHWIIVFFVFSLVSGLIASKIFRVEI